MLYTLELVMKSFLDKNSMKEDEVRFNVIDKDTVEVNTTRDIPRGDQTIYHGLRYDVFHFEQTSSRSGVLTYDDALTRECYDKCCDY